MKMRPSLFLLIQTTFLFTNVTCFIPHNIKQRHIYTKTNMLPSNLVNEVIQKDGILGDPFSFTELINNMDLHKIKDITLIKDTDNLIAIDNLNGVDIGKENLHVVTNIPQFSDFLLQKINENNINFDIFVTPPSFLSRIPVPIAIVFIYLLVVGFFNILRSNQMSGLNLPNNPLNMMSQNIKQVNQVNVTFADVAGIDEVKYELTEVVDFLKNPIKYQDMGARIPSGILLEGPPGTGKTLLARAVAGEAGVNFLTVSGSEFIEMFVGVGASRVRKLFETARQLKPCVIFIDEIDAIGRQRGAGVSGGNDEREQTLNQILTNMDGFENSDGIIVLAATNRVDILDSALKRPGRFDRKVYVNLPDTQGREDIFNIHIRNKQISKNVNTTDVALLTGGFSGADLENLANEAAIMGVRENNTQISMNNILDAYEKITIGLPNLVDRRDKSTQKIVSFHEAGHALLALYFDEFFDLEKVTKRANKNGVGGYTLFKPIESYVTFPTKKFLLANMIVIMGGRAAEIVFNRQLDTNSCSNNCSNTDGCNDSLDNVFSGFTDLDVTTGASGDLKQINNLARRYIGQYGLGEELLYDNVDPTQPFLGRDMASPSSKNSESTQYDIDMAVKKLVDFALDTAVLILNNNFEYLDNLANMILDNETVSYNEIPDYKF